MGRQLDGRRLVLVGYRSSGALRTAGGVEMKEELQNFVWLFRHYPWGMSLALAIGISVGFIVAYAWFAQLHVSDLSEHYVREIIKGRGR